MECVHSFSQSDLEGYQPPFAVRFNAEERCVQYVELVWIDGFRKFTWNWYVNTECSVTGAPCDVASVEYLSVCLLLFDRLCSPDRVRNLYGRCREFIGQATLVWADRFSEVTSIDPMLDTAKEEPPQEVLIMCTQAKSCRSCLITLSPWSPLSQNTTSRSPSPHSRLF